MNAPSSYHTPPTGRGLRCPALLLGLALGGFFDGILLHQILQWHHLLSNVAAVRSLRAQVMADGLFHAAMYVITLAGLWLLWRRRSAAAEAMAGRHLVAHALIGFGAWHIVDAVLSHWLLGLHRIRMDVPDPLRWDLLWLVVFGLLPALLGGWLLRRGPGGGSGPRGTAVASMLALGALLAGPIAAWPVSGQPATLVLFAPGTSPAAAFDALGRVDARVLWVDASGGLWAVRLSEPGARSRLYRSGALLVSPAGLAVGCLQYTRADLRL